MSGEKIRIEKNSVQETLIIPLYGRKLCAEKFPDLYTDQSAKRLCEKLDYNFSEQEAKKNSFFYQFAALEVAVRQLDMMWEIQQYLKNMGVKDVGGFFYINRPDSELKDWSSHMTVSSKGYMLGYYGLYHQGIDRRHRLLAKIGDKILKMAIMRIEF